MIVNAEIGYNVVWLKQGADLARMGNNFKAAIYNDKLNVWIND